MPKADGCFFFLHGRWNPLPLVAPLPSRWYLVRLLFGQEDPRVRAAKDAIYRWEGSVQDRRAVLKNMIRENKDLAAKLEAACLRYHHLLYSPAPFVPSTQPEGAFFRRGAEIAKKDKQAAARRQWESSPAEMPFGPIGPVRERVIGRIGEKVHCEL